jgi:type II secretory ATPase GspE/PulE/Tfp pilus assembly ATPase PilB-like protein
MSMAAPLDQWYFEIGDGKTYGPYPLEKLRKWAESGNLMPTHRVRNAESNEWIIAAYVPGLEITNAVPDAESAGGRVKDAAPKSLGAKVRGLTRKAPKAPSQGADGDAGVVADVSAEPGDVTTLCESMLQTAFERGASDIHVDPEEKVVLVQLRVDGELSMLRKLPKALHSPLVTRFKVLANMDIAEKREPQDGRFVATLGTDQRRVSIRAACLPTTHGERLTLRLLALGTSELTLNKLGMSKANYETFVKHASQNQGMILLTGPTGSGKSTTLYAALRYRLAHFPGRIITVEDPVEYDIVGVSQSEVDSADKLRFDTALRTILRSDPDVIMIGEIRDFDSVDIAIKAALTGHLVFSSLHANSAAGVITRLIDMGVMPYQVAATLKLCVAQRLIRRLCTNCRVARGLSAGEAAALGRPQLAGAMVYAAGHCEACGGRGYRGRVGIFEMLPITDELAQKVIARCDEVELFRYMHERRIPRLWDDAIDRLLDGSTSNSEILAVPR